MVSHLIFLIFRGRERLDQGVVYWNVSAVCLDIAKDGVVDFDRQCWIERPDFFYLISDLIGLYVAKALKLIQCDCLSQRIY